MLLVKSCIFLIQELCELAVLMRSHVGVVVKDR